MPKLDCMKNIFYLFIYFIHLLDCFVSFYSCDLDLFASSFYFQFILNLSLGRQFVSRLPFLRKDVWEVSIIVTCLYAL